MQDPSSCDDSRDQLLGPSDLAFLLSLVSCCLSPSSSIPPCARTIIDLAPSCQQPFTLIQFFMAPPQYSAATAHPMEHSAEYYQQLEEDLNVLELTQRVYGKGSESMLTLVKNFWYQ